MQFQCSPRCLAPNQKSAEPRVYQSCILEASSVLTRILPRLRGSVKTLGFPRSEFAHACSSLAAEAPEPHPKLGDDLLQLALNPRPLKSQQIERKNVWSQQANSTHLSMGVSHANALKKADVSISFAPNSLAIEKAKSATSPIGFAELSRVSSTMSTDVSVKRVRHVQGIHVWKITSHGRLVPMPFYMRWNPTKKR